MKNNLLYLLMIVLIAGISGFIGSKFNHPVASSKVAIIDSDMLLANSTELSKEELQEKIMKTRDFADSLVKKGYIVISGEAVYNAPKKHFIRIN
ncbi:MAG: hypothetical protein HON94_02700 [Methylococcales bacterium]|nr:hypothetical protein [Methylococcales bacterium]